MPVPEEELSDFSVRDEEGQSLSKTLFRHKLASSNKGNKALTSTPSFPHDKAQYLLPLVKLGMKISQNVLEARVMRKHLVHQTKQQLKEKGRNVTTTFFERLAEKEEEGK